MQERPQVWAHVRVERDVIILQQCMTLAGLMSAKWDVK
jgi:hypothetical protein